MFTQRAGKNCIPLCSRTVIIAEARLRIPKQNIVRIAESIVLLWQKDDRFLYIVGLCRNPCTGLSMQTGGDMPVFWRRKPCSAGKLDAGKRVEAIVPVPMYSKKERYRGYNQAALFGRALSEKMDIPCIPRLMIRMKDTRPQKELNGRERENNVKNAFQSSDNVVKYKRILIVDDIYTTGSTVEAVAERLKEAGAEQVYVLTACIGRGF